jgi:hypothetical protein
VHAHLETDRPTYQLGDSIGIRIALVSRAAVPLDFTTMAAWHLVDLVVTDSTGRRVAPASPVDNADTFRHNRFTLPARATVPWALGPGRRWVALRHWGYELRVPGRYTIAAIPLVAGPNLEPDLATVRSNQVTITITP